LVVGPALALVVGPAIYFMARMLRREHVVE
jgi:hypothetical protein